MACICGPAACSAAASFVPTLGADVHHKSASGRVDGVIAASRLAYPALLHAQHCEGGGAWPFSGVVRLQEGFLKKDCQC